ncbi:MAG: formylglycine-generating enzyme family protein [Pigmentiphaga sp.]|nr:formylglycine-generating enzyme family protein [Pigmentiphaga sp.]
MRFLPGGAFLMGSNRFYPEEAPIRRTAIDAFWIDETPVTNADFGAFVRATGYLTLAEREPDPALVAGLPPEFARAGSMVFDNRNRVPSGTGLPWWPFRAGACWRRPLGEGSGIDDLADHPVVHIACEDAEAYAHWAGKSLPTEAEWEYAARGGLADADYAWGDELAPGGIQMANTWQGEFPWTNLALDGWERTSPVRSYPANGHGLYDMIGNVWEWTADWWHERAEPPQARILPRGGSREATGGPSIRRAEPPQARILPRGGSREATGGPSIRRAEPPQARTLPRGGSREATGGRSEPTAQPASQGAPSCCAERNPTGGSLADSCDPALAVLVPRRVIKGGSHLCAPNYCRRYRPAARHAQAVDTSTSHIGFRCVVRTAGLG